MNGIACAFQGRVARDPELRFTSSGVAFLSLSIAVHDSKAEEGAPTEWVSATVWEGRAEELAEQLKKGDECYIEGRLKLWQGEGRDGTTRASLSVSAWKCEVLGAIGRRAPRPRAARDAPDRRVPTGGGWLQAGDLAGSDRSHLA